MIFFRSVISIVKIAGVMKFEFQRNLEIRLSITGIFYPVCNYDFLLNKIAQEVIDLFVLNVTFHQVKYFRTFVFISPLPK